MAGITYKELNVASVNDAVSTELMGEMQGCLDEIDRMEAVSSFSKTKRLPAAMFDLFAKALEYYDWFIDHTISAE